MRNPKNKQISGNFIEYYQIINIYELAFGNGWREKWADYSLVPIIVVQYNKSNKKKSDYIF